MTPSQLIKSARKAAGITQAELAKKIGVATGRISDYERGKYCPSYELVCRIMDTTGFAITIIDNNQSSH